MYTRSHAHDPRRRSGQLPEAIEDAAVLVMLFSAAAILAAIVLLLILI